MRSTLCSALLASVGTLAGAAPVGYHFQGQVLDDSVGRGFQGFSGSFRFDSLTPDAIADTSTGAYLHAAPSWRLELSFDGGASRVFDDSLALLTSNDFDGQDQLGVLATHGGDSVSLTLFDFLALALVSDALPVQPLTLAQFGWSTLLWDGAAGQLNGQLTSLGCVEGCVGGSSHPPRRQLAACWQRARAGESGTCAGGDGHHALE